MMGHRHFADPENPRPRFNEGWAWAYPLESSYARKRRRFVANPAVNQQTLQRYEESTSPPCSSNSLDSLLAQETESQPIRQCPTCAKKLFHSVVYQLPCLQLCPFHHQPLTLACPDCHKSWACPSSRTRVHCQTCEYVSWDDCAQMSLKRSVLRRVQKVDRWLANAIHVRRRPPKMWVQDQRLQTSWVSSAESARFLLPTHHHSFFAAFEAAQEGERWRKTLDRLHVRTVKSQLRTNTTTLSRWHGRYTGETWDQLMNGTLPAMSLKSRGMMSLAVRRILRWQTNWLEDSHRLVWRDFRDLRVLENSDLYCSACPLCLAFSLWCQALTLKHFLPGLCSSPGDHDLCRLTRYISFPVTPEAIYFGIPPRGTFAPTAAFELWFYLRSTDYLFLELFLLVRWFRRCLEKELPYLSGSAFDGRYQFRMPHVGSQLMDCALESEGGIKVSYWYETPLEELALADEERLLIRKCENHDQEGLSIVWAAQNSLGHLTCSALNELFSSAAPAFHTVQAGCRWIPQEFLTALDWHQPGTKSAVIKVDQNNHPLCFHPASFTN